MGQNSIQFCRPLVPLSDGSGFLLPRQETPVHLENPDRFTQHILCQIFDTYKILFSIRFFKIEHTKGPIFAAQFEQMVRNCPNSTLKANLEMSPAGREIGPQVCQQSRISLVSEGKGSTVSIGLFVFSVSQRFFLLRARTSHAHKQIKQSCQ